ncbi:MAG: sigma-54-dependent Fis family transcriptional regulator [Bacteroidetes bacterium]|nr:MAG: sigma-54-dependent Fis family transcriptional regulator [Bacteroidota bacterium]RLD72558.1 MAG: sigma-54-dependent Fis family transcriptional regulator [Bacteroidota bacterium]RLD94961.1 MAG: sigma-54-dependent Fis family transcriptional regulator [Bacteroidota bacterium]
MMEIQQIKQRFSIIGTFPGLDRAIDIAMQVAPTDLSVLISGESGTGKEVFPQIIHSLGVRKHGPYIAVNCGAIPEGTIDSELFGHEKGAFTGAHDTRKGYFEVSNGGTIFLDEIAELPLSTQVRLLRVLETGEYIRVGSSKVLKTDVRVVAATNLDVVQAIKGGKFREDLFYRLNTVPIQMPSLRERGNDILLLFRKFAADFSERYRMPAIRLDEEARQVLLNYEWPGNIRQLKNITEQLSVIEQDREVSAAALMHYLPDYHKTRLPALIDKDSVTEEAFNSEREILYKVLFDMKSDMNDLKKLVAQIMEKGSVSTDIEQENEGLIKKLYSTVDDLPVNAENLISKRTTVRKEREEEHILDTEEIVEESLSLEDKEIELIIKALDKHNGKRKYAAQDLGISERTLYRKIKEYNIE